VCSTALFFVSHRIDRASCPGLFVGNLWAGELLTLPDRGLETD